MNAVLISMALLVACTLVHYEILSFMKGRLVRIAVIPRKAKLLVAIFGAMGSHALHIVLFAAAYTLLRDKLGLGQFGGNFEDTFSSFLYFSIETYTSLGLGDIFPMGSIRLLAGTESLTGLVMIGWTASFTYMEMSQYWKDV